jgi:hypothetical protein
VLPDVLHFCQFYRAGEFGFQKRRIKKQMFECGHEMMAELPRDLGKINYKNRDGEVRSELGCWVMVCCLLIAVCCLLCRRGYWYIVFLTGTVVHTVNLRVAS